MKIYFEDGNLKELPKGVNFIIDAKDGVTNNLNDLKNLQKKMPNCVVWTNSILAFSNEYAWDKISKVPEIYLRVEKEFVRIDQLTNKALRESHNLAKLYIAGHFEKENL